MPNETIAILPLGAHEQHGPHLPFDTDTRIAEGIAARLKAQVTDLDLVVLPVEPVGYSIEHMDVAGTKTLTFDAAVHRWLGICEAQAEAGIARLMMLNAHGGNAPLMTVVATEARVRFGMLAVATSWTRFGLPEGLMTPEDKALDIHAGEIETSVMLALHPDRVAMDRARAFPSAQAAYAERFRHLRAYGPHAFGWAMRDLNPDGAAGRADRATAAKGEAILAHAVNGLAELLHDIDAFDLGDLARL